MQKSFVAEPVRFDRIDYFRPVTLSLSHLSPSTLEMLEGIEEGEKREKYPPLYVGRRKGGWEVYVGKKINDPRYHPNKDEFVTEKKLQTLPEDLQACFRYAWKVGADTIMFENGIEVNEKIYA